MMDFLSTAKNSENFPIANYATKQINLYDKEPYTAYTEDLEFMWRWTIYRDKKLVQEGCSLTQDASKRAIGHVLAFLNIASQPVLQDKEN